jgi:dihydroorotate dehydrogenase (fumarate)
MAGASPLSATVEGARRLEDAGSSAIVLPSLFEEGVMSGEIAVRSFYRDHDPLLDQPAIPAATALGLSPRDYIDHLGKVKKAVRVPVIASLNGTGLGDWIKVAPVLEREGADALELNLYTFAAEPWDPGQAAELRMIELVRGLRSSVRIPIAVKLSPFYTSLPHFARELDYAGAEGFSSSTASTRRISIQRGWSSREPWTCRGPPSFSCASGGLRFSMGKSGPPWESRAAFTAPWTP